MYLEIFKEIGNTQDWKLILGYGTSYLTDPLLYLLMKERKDDERGTHRTALLKLSPCNSEIEVMWRLREDDEDKRMDIVRTTVNALYRTPTLFLPGTIDDDYSELIPIFIYIASGKAQGEEVLESVRKPDRNPQKILHEQSRNLKHLYKAPTPPLDYGKARELVEIQLTQDRIQAEMMGFDYAYRGMQNLLGNVTGLSVKEMHDFVESMIKGE